MELYAVSPTGMPTQWHTDPGDAAHDAGVLGVAVSPKAIDEVPHTVVQLLLDDDVVGFDGTLLDHPLLAELRSPAGDVITRDLFDHHEFRERLAAEEAEGGGELRGVVVRTAGDLPPHYIRLAFLSRPIAETAGCQLVVVRADRDELLTSIDDGLADGSLSPGEHTGLRTSVEQRHPAGGPT